MADHRLVVKEDIPMGGVLAYTRGQYITQEAVTENGWDDLVVSTGTKEGRELLAEITGRSADDFTTTTTAASSRRTASTTPQEG